MVPAKDYSRDPYRPDQTLDTVWSRALAAAKRTEEEVGVENLGPWDDFDWGMLNGKLSALRHAGYVSLIVPPSARKERIVAREGY